MTQQNNDSTNEYDCLIQEAIEQIEQQQYLEAINNLDYIIENRRDGYAFFLRGKAYSSLKEYKTAMKDYETALDIYRKTENKKYQVYTVYTLFNLSFIYPFNGKIREGFLAQQKSLKIAKELNLSEDDPLYSYISHAPQMSDEGLDNTESQLRNIDSISFWQEFGLMGKLIEYGTRGKLQSYLSFSILFLIIMPSFALAILTSPFWLPITIYKSWRERNDS